LTKEEVMQQALETLRGIMGLNLHNVQRTIESLDNQLKKEQENTDWEAVAADQALTIALLKAELEQDEPVGKVSDHDWSTGLLYRDLEPGTPLYTTPQPRKPLTDEQKKNIFLKFYGKHWAYTNQIKNVMEAVEAAHGIKENT